MKSLVETSCSSSPDPLWAKLWKFSWHACWDIIPHGLNLFRKGIPNFVACPRCGGHESLLHLILECPWVQELWKVAKFSFPRIIWHFFRDLLDWVLSVKGLMLQRFLCPYVGKFGRLVMISFL